MNTHPGDRLRIADLAGLPALQRALPATAFTRLARLVSLEEPVLVSISVHRDEHGRDWLQGSAKTRVAIACQRCLEPVVRPLAIALDLWLVDRQGLPRLQRVAADQLAQADVREVDDGSFELTTLVEDELLLGMDEQPCRDTACPNMPAMSYGNAAADLPTDDERVPATTKTDGETQRPFAELRQLLEDKQEPER